MALTPITADQQRFAQRVAQGTGLSLATVLTWMHAEGGPITNPLNIMVPGTQTVENYGSPDRAADAVVANLKTSRYANVLQTARETTDPKAQLAAIAQSPWDAGHYTGGIAGAAWGTTLLGSLAGAQASASAAGITGTWEQIKEALGMAGASLSPVTAGAQAAQSVAGVFDPKNWLGGLTGWISGTAATGLAYVVLTLLGIGLVFVGLNEATGREATRHLAQGKGIPVEGAIA